MESDKKLSVLRPENADLLLKITEQVSAPKWLTEQMRGLTEFASVVKKVDEENQKWLRRSIVKKAKRALAADELGESDKKIIAENLQDFEECFDHVANMKFADRYGALAAIEAAFAIVVLSPPDDAVKKELRTKQIAKAQAEKIKNARALEAETEKAFRQVAAEKGFRNTDLKAGEKWIDLHLLKAAAEKMGKSTEDLPKARKLIEIVSKIKKESISD
jgi:hypothetical protein